MMTENLAALLEQRFGVTVDVPPELARLDELVHAAAHRHALIQKNSARVTRYGATKR